MKLLLASKSPRRQQLLEQMGLSFECVQLDCDEALDVPAEELAEALAIKKSSAYAELKEGEVLLTADTTVLLEGEALNKPVDHIEASRMLSRLSGRTHIVRTGVCLRSLDKQYSFHESTHVQFANLDREEIDHYIDLFKPFDKAGGYGIQEWIGLIGIRSIQGCYYNVMGLPCQRLHAAIKTEFPKLLA